MTWSTARSGTAILLLALLIFASRLIGINASNPNCYDELAYYSAAQRLAGGERPYQDFLFVHPPGLLCSDGLSISLGLSLPGLRIAHALSAIILGGIVFLIARRVSGPYAPPLAVLLLFSSPTFFQYTRMVTTDLPAATLLAAAILVITVRRSGYIPLSAALIVGSSLFRLQGLFYVPCVLVFIALAEGERKKAIAACLGFVVWVTVCAAACHGLAQFAWPRYFESVVRIQMTRPRLGLAERYVVINQSVSNLTFSLGLLSSLLLLGRRCASSRGLGAFTVLAVLLTSTLFNSLFESYFLTLLPYASVCAATVISDVASSYAGGVTALLAAAFIGTVQVPQLVLAAKAPLRLAARDADFLATIRSLPGRTALTGKPGIAVLCGKRVTSDYYSTDPFGANLAGKFDEFIANSLSQSDIIIIDSVMVYFMSQESSARILASGKTLYFHRPDDKKDWEAKFAGARPLPGAEESPIAKRRPIDVREPRSPENDDECFAAGEYHSSIIVPRAQPTWLIKSQSGKRRSCQRVLDKRRIAVNEKRGIGQPPGVDRRILDRVWLKRETVREREVRITLARRAQASDCLLGNRTWCELKWHMSEPSGQKAN
jgi:hypothetical protein